MYGIFDTFIWACRVALALLLGNWREVVTILAALFVAGCTLVYVPADTRWTVQAGDGGTAAALEQQKDK